MQRPITVLLPVRDRSGVRLDNCLRSLRWQDGVRAADVEVLISDLGSGPAALEDLRAVAARSDARVIHTAYRGPWNKSRALNIGLRRAEGRLTMCADVDMVFAPNFLHTVLETQCCRCGDTPGCRRRRSTGALPPVSNRPRPGSRRR